MKLGCGLPTLGSLAGPDAIMRAAQRAEALGYHSAWVADRLLAPVAPRSPYPATPDGVLPEYFKRSMDPVEALTFAAAHTRRLTLGTSVLNMPFYNPVVLARSSDARRIGDLAPILANSRWDRRDPALPWLLAVLCQAPGVMAERWFFFAQAKHPQNLYYQVVS